MDQNRFDTFARALNGAVSRRNIARGLFAITTGFAATRAPLAATARKRRKKKRGPKPTNCPVCQQRVNGQCDSTILNNELCGECGICFNGVCTPAKRDCGGVCTFCHETATCRTSPDDTTCLGDGSCVDGTCRKPV